MELLAIFRIEDIKNDALQTAASIASWSSASSISR